MKKNNPDKRLKILIINYEFPPLGGGGGVATYDLAVEWAKKADVDVITSSFKDLQSFEVMDNINVHRVKIFFRKSRDAASFISLLTYLPGAFFKGIGLFRKNRYDVINTHFAVPSGPIGYLLGKIFRTPNVLSLHGGDIYDPSKKMSPHKSFFWRSIVKFMLNTATRLVAQSSNTRDNTIKYYKPKQEVAIIPLAFHPPKPPKKKRKDLNINKNDYILITIGRLVKRKAIDVLINALAEIKNEKIKLLVLGDGPEQEPLSQLSSDLGIKDRVQFLGYVDEDDKYNYLANANLFTLVSMHEGFGIVYMEGMYFGLPVICSDHGGQTDFLREEENALLISVGDIQACKAAIEKMYTDKKLYKKCSENNKNKVKDFYAEAVADEYIKVFKEITT
ncbi:MAG: glycosyltransferase family 4 protein [bacterium]|nr:glycosyltransferase family 4 protein [bacterium]